MAANNSLPGVLQPPAPNSAISMERALNQIRELLLESQFVNDAQEDKLNASLDDLDVMLRCIDRG